MDSQNQLVHAADAAAEIFRVNRVLRILPNCATEPTKDADLKCRKGYSDVTATFRLKCIPRNTLRMMNGIKEID